MTTVQVVRQSTDLPVDSLTFDSEVQCRESIEMGTVAQYKGDLASGVVFPPLVVFFDGKTNWVADGFHRGQAYREAGASTCPCDVRQGTKRDAILYAVGANSTHGLPRTNKDKRRAVMTLLNDAEWRQWSNREISKRAGVSDKTVTAIRSELEPVASAEIPKMEATRKAIRNGKEYEINTSNIGKAKSAERVEAKPEHPQSEEAVSETEDQDEENVGAERAVAKLAGQFGVGRATVERAQDLQHKDPAAFEKVCAGEIDGRKAWNEVKAKERGKAGKVEEPKKEVKNAVKSITEYMPVNTDTPDEIIRLTEANIQEVLDDAWERCTADHRWKLIARVENVVATFKEDNCQ